MIKLNNTIKMITLVQAWYLPHNRQAFTTSGYTISAVQSVKDVITSLLIQSFRPGCVNAG